MWSALVSAHGLKNEVYHNIQILVYEITYVLTLKERGIHNTLSFLSRRTAYRTILNQRLSELNHYSKYFLRTA